MKQEQEETTIKELFQRLKKEDERRAPSFTDSWGAAQARMETRGRAFRAQASNSIARRALVQSWSRMRWALAAAAAILIACGFIVYRAIQNESHKDRVVITENVPAQQPYVTRNGHVAKDAIEPEPRRESRAPQPRRGNRPRLNTPSIHGDSVAADAKRSEDLTEFFLLRYGDDPKPMGSGGVIRVQMPRSALITLGLPVNVERADEAVTADLLIGEDGLARAIRFVR